MSLITGLEGRLEAKGPDYALVKVGGFTLHIHIPTPDLSKIGSEGDDVQLHTQLIVREDDIQIFGFSSEKGSHIFELLREVGGVGPKLALAILSALSPDEIAASIVSEDSSTLTRAPGVGKRTGERIILELKDKLSGEFIAVAPTINNETKNGDQAFQALVALGFTPFEVRQALSVEADNDLSMEEKISNALRRLGDN